MLSKSQGQVWICQLGDIIWYMQRSISVIALMLLYTTWGEWFWHTFTRLLR